MTKRLETTVHRLDLLSSPHLVLKLPVMLGNNALFLTTKCISVVLKLFRLIALNVTIITCPKCHKNPLDFKTLTTTTRNHCRNIFSEITFYDVLVTLVKFAFTILLYAFFRLNVNVMLKRTY